MTKLTAGLAAVLLALVVTGCGESGDGGSSNASNTNANSETAGGNNDAVAWADEVCSSIKDDVAALTETPNVDPNNLQATKDAMVTYIGKLETAVDSMGSAVDEAGAPPIDGGEEAVTAFQDQIATAKEAVSNAKTKAEAAPVNDPAAFQQAFTEVGQEMSSIGDLDPTSSFESSAELKSAFEKAQSCKEIDNMEASPVETPTS